MKHDDPEQPPAALQQADETRPLLKKEYSRKIFEIEEIRIRARAEPKLDDYDYVEWENLPGYMVLHSIASAMVQVMVVLGAYFFMQSSGHDFTPQCRMVYYGLNMDKFSTDQEHVKAYLCYATTFSFWTYPITCPLAVIAVYWKNLLDKRLFYECLLNRIFLGYSSVSALVSPVFWFLVIYLACSLSSVWYIKNTLAWQSKTLTDLIFGLLAYLSPIFAFLIVLFTHFSANANIVTLPKYMERDREKATKLLNSCIYMSASDFCIAFRRSEKLLEQLNHEARVTAELNTPELMYLIRDQHERRGEVSFLEQVDCSCRCWRIYWVAEVLWAECLVDWRSWRFRFFAGVYILFMVLAILIYLYAMVYTVHRYVVFQGEVAQDFLPSPERVWDSMKHAHVDYSG